MCFMLFHVARKYMVTEVGMRVLYRKLYFKLREW